MNVSFATAQTPRPAALPTSPWLLRFPAQTQPRLRLICFPYAGVDANIFRAWAAAAPPGVEVIGIQYPGRGGHAGTPVNDCATLVQRLLPELVPLLNLDFAFFGHSNGALVSYEVARALPATVKYLQRHHFLSAREPVHLGSKRVQISELDNAHFMQAIRALGGTPDEVLNDAALMNLLVPRLRADFWLGEHYRYQPGPGIDCDATVFYGAQDDFIDASEMARWSELIGGNTQLHRIDGAHFFMHSHQREMLATIWQRSAAASSHSTVNPL